MNKEELNNLLAMANIAIQSGRITDPDQLIAAGWAMKAGKATLDIMQEGQVVTVLTVIKPSEKPKAIKAEILNPAPKEA